MKTAKAGGPRGFDGGKRVKGRKRHLIVDTLGLMVEVAVTPANVHDTKGGQKALTKMSKWIAPPWEGKLFVDGGYQGAPFANWVKGKIGIDVEIKENPALQAKKFVPVEKRWVVERSFAWMEDYRRLIKDHERLLTHSTAMIRWAMIRLILVRLTT